jgi:hypothetical protein
VPGDFRPCRLTSRHGFVSRMISSSTAREHNAESMARATWMLFALYAFVGPITCRVFRSEPVAMTLRQPCSRRQARNARTSRRRSARTRYAPNAGTMWTRSTCSYARRVRAARPSCSIIWRNAPRLVRWLEARRSQLQDRFSGGGSASRHPLQCSIHHLSVRRLSPLAPRASLSPILDWAEQDMLVALGAAGGRPALVLPEPPLLRKWPRVMMHLRARPVA